MAKRRIGLLRRSTFFSKKSRVVVNRQVHYSAMELHRHEFFEIVIVLSGSAVHVADQSRHRIESRDVLVLHSRRAHGYEETSGLNIVNILIRGDLMQRLGRELGGLPGYHSLFTLESTRRPHRDYVSHLHLSPAELGQVEEWSNRLEEETAQAGPDGPVLAEAYLTLIVGLLCRRYGKKTGLPARSEGRFGRILSWIEKKLDGPISVAELAREMGLSERTLHRRFRLTVGVTPAAYLLQARLRRAADRLGRGPWEPQRIVDVAAACGFEDSNYFSRCFRKFTGRTPRDFRKSAQALKRRQ